MRMTRTSSTMAGVCRAGLCMAIASVILCMTACNNVSTVPQGTATCLSEVGFKVLGALASEERLNIIDYAQITQKCAYPIADLVDQVRGSHNLEAVVKELPLLESSQAPGAHTLHAAHSSSVQDYQLGRAVPQDATFPYTFTGSVIPNCSSDTGRFGTYFYNLPLVLIVGSSEQGGGAFQGTTFIEPLPGIPSSSSYELLPPSGAPFLATTDEERIASRIYTDQGLPQYFNKPGQSSDSFPLTIPAHMQVQLHLPLTIHYRLGEGVVNHGGQAGPGMLWAYAYTFERDFDPSHLTLDQEAMTPCP